MGYKYQFLHLIDGLHEKGGIMIFLPNACKIQPKKERLGCLKHSQGIKKGRLRFLGELWRVN